MDMETDIFVQLLSECSREMYMISYRILKNHYDAEDVMSNTVMKAFEKRDTLHNRSKFKAWIIQILINEVRQFIRRQGRVVVTAYPCRGIEAVVSNGYRELWDLVCSLQQELRDVIILHYDVGVKRYFAPNRCHTRGYIVSQSPSKHLHSADF